MKVACSWLREFAPTDLDAEALGELISRQGVKVEGIIRPWAGLDGVVVATVIEVRNHPDSQKLCVAVVNDGHVEREVVVGVRNMAPGDRVPWARPGDTVPVLDEPLGARQLRGVVSNGMLCSPRELKIADSHEGILILNDEDVSPGDDLRTAFGLDEAVLDIEVEPNRPDFLSVYGVAREVAAATGVPLSAPAVPVNASAQDTATVVSVRLDAPEACARYVARVIRGLETGGASPVRVQARLTASGMRPLFNVVDATNYTMLELGQPLHAFDLQRLAGPGIVVRHASEGETLRTLDDVERTLAAEDLLICDLERPVAIAGVMGGASTEVSRSTTEVLLESAAFERSGILRTARRLDLHSEASHRFERGVDPEGLDRAAARAAELIVAWSGGRTLPGVAEAGERTPRHWVGVRPSRAAMLLDEPIAVVDATAVFDALQMQHRDGDDRIEVEVPGYRMDIDREVDLIEEVARVRGYDRIGSRLPSAGQVGGAPAGYAFRARARAALVSAGLREIRPSPFASADDLTLTGDTDAIRVANPLQSDDAFLRTRLTPGLVKAVAHNQAMGTAAASIFEVGTVFRTGDPVQERPKLAFAVCGPAETGWWVENPRPLDVLDAKGVLASVMAELAVPDWGLGEEVGDPFHPARSAAVTVAGERAGVIGELLPRIATELGVQGRLAIAELELDALMTASQTGLEFRDPPRFPPVRRDLAFVVGTAIPAGAVQDLVTEAAGELLSSVLLFDVHRGAPIPAGSVGLAFALDFRAPDRTLTSEEVDRQIERIARRLAEELGATLRA